MWLITWQFSFQKAAQRIEVRGGWKLVSAHHHPGWIYCNITLFQNVGHQTTRIPNSSSCCCCSCSSVTKTVTWRYLGNQACYHSSAGVKTTRKKICIKKRKKWVRPGVRPWVRPGLRPGVWPGVRPGFRPGVRPGVRPGPSRGPTPDGPG